MGRRSPICGTDSTAAERSPIRRGLKYRLLRPGRAPVHEAAERSPIRRGLKFRLLGPRAFDHIPQQNDPRSGGD